jgi:3-oxoacyl-[acyl-carrier protein] reductase
MRTAIITGAESGIGAAVAERFRAAGIKVFSLDLAASADFQVDISKSEQVKSAVAQIGSVDILINSAGITGPNTPLADVSDADWNRTIAINLNGTFNTCRAVVPGMVERGWGRIVNIASIAGKEGNPNLSAYSASKAAVIGLTKSLGKELATTGVLVNAITPAFIQTPMNVNTTEETLKYMISKIPMNRVGQVEEVAALISWLASDECTFSTGAVFDISGGRATY